MIASLRASAPALLVTVVACASGVHKFGERVDLTLIRPYTDALENTAPSEPPYLVTFRSDRSSSELNYLAVAHLSSEGYPDRRKHPTLIEIENLFSVSPPDAVVIEGVDPWSGEFPQYLIKEADQCELRSYRNCGEVHLVIKRATERNLAIFTGEPRQNAIREFLNQEGYSVEDMLGFYTARQIPEWKRDGIRTHVGIVRSIEKFLADWQSDLKLKSPFTRERFEAWYRRNVPAPSVYDALTEADTAPDSAQGAAPLRKIASRVGVLRDRSIVGTIAHAADEHRRVLVVYGASHFLTERPALERLYGLPTYSGGKLKKRKNSTVK